MQYNPLLCVEWNDSGLLDRYNSNNSHSKAAIENHFNTFGQQVPNSTTLWGFTSSNELTTALSQLVVLLPWTRHIDRHEDVCGTFMIQTVKKKLVYRNSITFLQSVNQQLEQ
jgi:hypothetical protein